MKLQDSDILSGVQVENTLSMALQSGYPKRRRGYLVVLALAGVTGSIFSFLTMFSPVYILPVFLAAAGVIFFFFSWTALHPGRSMIPVLTAVLLYCALFFWQKTRITNGLMYLTNDVCQAIYMTDWEYFVTDLHYPEADSVTCVLCFLAFPVIWMICYAVLRYQNFFLSLLVTFPFIEIGLFFGIVPQHLFAVLLAAFWFAMAGVQMAGSGITQNGGKTGFLRKKNAFFPVAGMRFMLPESTGVLILGLVMLVFGITELFLHQSGYERPEQFKQLRTDFQNYIASLHMSGDLILDNYGEAQESQPDDETHIPLGSLDEKIYENIPVASAAFSENPGTRIYLKYRTGKIYNGSAWTMPEDSALPEILNYFELLDYYPPEFLYATLSGGNPLQMSLYHPTGILSQCIPYGFQKNQDIHCQSNDLIRTETQTYLIHGNTDYEELLSNPDEVTRIRLDALLPSCEAEDISILSELTAGQERRLVFTSHSSDLSAYYFQNAHTARAAEAGILCGSFYDDLVYQQDTVLPDTPALQAVRQAYAPLLRDFDARTASASEIITKLEDLRDEICDHVSYTLAPGRTPSGSDHTAYFLLENRKGYCEHYATAGTVLARMAGIPARYCEGYMIDCSRDGTLTKSSAADGSTVYTAELLDSSAHAWTEIYISGLGWIPFEFTYSYFTSRTRPERPVPETRETRETIVPTSPVPTEPPTQPPTEPPVPEQKEIPVKMLVLIIFLTTAAFCCLLALIFRIARLSAIRKRMHQYEQEDRKAAGLCAYRYLTDLLAECGVAIKGTTIGELVEDSERHCSQYMDSFYSLSAAVQLGAKLRYSPHPMTGSELHYLLQAAESLAEGMYRQGNLFRRFYLKWLRHYL